MPTAPPVIDLDRWLLGDRNLTRREHQILTVLSQRPGDVTTYEDLYRAIWGYAPLNQYGHCDSRTVSSHVHRLRRKGVEGIQNVWGVGFRFTPDPDQWEQNGHEPAYPERRSKEDSP